MSIEFSLKDFLSSSNSSPAFVVGNYNVWTDDDAQSIAADLYANLKSFPLVFVPEESESKKFRKVNYPEIILSSKSSETNIPCVNVLGAEGTLINYKFSNCKVPVCKIVEAVTAYSKAYSENEIVLFLKDLFFRLANTLKASEKAKKEREQKERKEREEKERKEREEKERKEREEKERREREKKFKMSFKDLPPTLQLTARPFDYDNIKGWLTHVQKLYKNYGVDEDNVVPFIEQHLPSELIPLHDRLSEKKYSDYCTEFLQVMDPTAESVSVLTQLHSISKKTNETTRSFIIRAANIASRDERITQNELVKILLGKMPREDAQLLVSSKCKTITELLDALNDAQYISKLISGEPQTSTALEKRLNALEKLVPLATNNSKKESDVFAAVASPSLDERLDNLVEKLENMHTSVPAAPSPETMLSEMWTMFVHGQGNRGGYNNSRGGKTFRGRGSHRGTNGYAPKNQGYQNYYQNNNGPTFQNYRGRGNFRRPSFSNYRGNYNGYPKNNMRDVQVYGKNGNKGYDKVKKNDDRASSRPICYFCGEPGHVIRDCTLARQNFRE